MNYRITKTDDFIICKVSLGKQYALFEFVGCHKPNDGSIGGTCGLFGYGYKSNAEVFGLDTIESKDWDFIEFKDIGLPEYSNGYLTTLDFKRGNNILTIVLNKLKNNEI